MRSTLLLLSGLVATAFSAAVPVERDALVAREKETVTVIVTVTSTTTRSSSTKRTTAQPTATVVYVTVTSFYTSQYPITSAPATYTGWTGFHPPWWSWFTASNHPVTVTDSIGPVTVYSPIYVTVTETDPGDDNYAATVTLPALTVPVKRDEGKHTHELEMKRACNV
ncbi:uncharacterized protein LY89DRAFT_411532 [Mollisia scopiformis]|uniref:Uncharacterized protein n=1 Tax=Mollisia scopiformis TaxID=149040 RepID=A0A132B2W5_MOLSC|nr:uncharacterized protein LY89DRAFT_411532 [Mollisia scopiformis]KUJ06379.1 hypothetical protein LY89DRAFT_411532 [Mollisia scopiformis]